MAASACAAVLGDDDDDEDDFADSEKKPATAGVAEERILKVQCGLARHPFIVGSSGASSS